MRQITEQTDDMTLPLPASLRSRFHIDGHFSPIKIFSAEEAAQVYQDYRGYLARFGAEGGRLEGDGRFRVHLLAGWAARFRLVPSHDSSLMP